MPNIRVAIHGAAGRMGQRLVALGSEGDQLEIVAALETAGHPRLGEDAGQIAGVGELGVALADSLDVDADVMIDFSVPAAADTIIATCRERGIALVMATTGLSDKQHEDIRQAATKIAVLWAPSMSLAVNLVMKLSADAALVLNSHSSGVDVEIIERHHRFKEDAPSGTALKFGQLIAEQMGQTVHQHGREGRPGKRPANEIGYHALRVGDNPGEHTIVFGLLGETIELSVRASSRDCYAHGALAAATFLASQPPGLYNMNDVLGIED